MRVNASAFSPVNGVVAMLVNCFRVMVLPVTVVPSAMAMMICNLR